MTMTDIIFRPKILKLYLAVVENSEEKHPKPVYRISLEVDLTYSHAVKTIQTFVKAKLFTSEKVGRNRRYSTTEKGKKVYKNLIAIREALRNK